MSTPDSYNVGPAEYRSHLALAREHGRDLWENNGWGVRSIEGPGDTLLWTSPYLLRSRPHEGPFVTEAASVLQSMLLHVDYTAGEKLIMHDNEFHASGWNGVEDLLPPEAVEIDETPEECVWRVGEMSYRAAPPEWSVRGSDRGITYDLAFRAATPAIWMTDPSVSTLESGDRWIMAYAAASGTVESPQRRISLAGRVWHERHIHLTTSYDPTRLLRGQGVLVHNGFSKAYEIFLAARPELGLYRARISEIDGRRTIEFNGPDQVSHEVLERWADPRSGFLIPCRWRIVLVNGRDRARFIVSGFARAYYLWNALRRGVNVLYWWLAESDGEIEFASGERRSVLLQHVVHQNRTFYHYP